MSRFTLARGVRADLRAIWRYIAVKNHSPDAADQVIGRLTAAFALLAREPLLGETRTDLAPGIRSFAVGSYLVLYATKGHKVRIIQVVHGSRDIFTTFRRPHES